MRESSAAQTTPIAGFAKPGFEAVREAFTENFDQRDELGAACCVFHRGEKVVDLWGGIRNKGTGEPWEEGTMALVWSTTKGVAGLTMALAHSRDLFDYEERVSTYWPEFAQQGKERITVRQLLSHQAGLFALDEHPDRSLIADPDRLAVVLARQKPVWPAGERQAYHALTLGFYESALLQRTDPKHRTLGQFFSDEIARPLGLDFYIRLPEDIPDAKLAPLTHGSMLGGLRGMPLPLIVAGVNPRSRLRRSLWGTELAEDKERVYARNLEMPAGGGVGTARALAHAYSVFATGGTELGLRKETLRQIMAPAIPPRRGFHDEVLKVEAQFSLGFMKPSAANPFAHPTGFGAPGSGGSLGFADPHAQIGFGYIPNNMGSSLQDPRNIALRTAVYLAIGEDDSFGTPRETEQRASRPHSGEARV
jgi:CubicO group peptidase (beta-lactamase class C family)